MPTTSQPSDWRSLTTDTVERCRRSEPRYPASDAVKLHLYEDLGTSPALVEGELVDRSNGGCKVRHRFGQLKVGQQVTMVINGLETEAIVVWTKSYWDHYDSGFSFLR